MGGNRESEHLGGEKALEAVCRAKVLEAVCRAKAKNCPSIRKSGITIHVLIGISPVVLRLQIDHLASLRRT